MQNINEIVNKFTTAKIIGKEQLTNGLINQTFLITTTDKKFILQKLNRMYDFSVLQKYQELETFLQESELKIPKLIKTLDGDMGLFDDEFWWRATEYFENDNLDYQQIDEEVAYELGKTLATIHKTLEIFPKPEKFLEFHNTQSKYEKLVDTISNNPFKAALVAPECRFVVNELEKLLPIPFEKLGMTHSDPKIFNFLFKNKKVIGIVDWDGARPGNIYLEIGDALRDWSMRDEKFFNLETFNNALAGYRENGGSWLKESDAIMAMKIITMELTARFLTDYFEESYFAWDKTKYKTSAEHNLQRTRDGIEYYKNINKYFI